MTHKPSILTDTLFNGFMVADIRSETIPIKRSIVMHTEIFKCVAGSRLYGTSTPDSDTDYKAVHLPTKTEILLGKGKDVVSTSTGAKDAANGKDDVDVESFTLSRYLQLASKMNTIPVEMLFIPEDKAETFSPMWQELRDNRHRIISKNANSFVGYCKAQAVKYSMRGSRLETFERVVAVLEGLQGNLPVIDQEGAREALTSIPHVTTNSRAALQTDGVLYLQVSGRQAPLTAKASEVLKVFRKPIDEAGSRTRAALEAGGADWKALYHAVRIVNEGITLFRHGEIFFPAANADLLLRIRNGDVNVDSVMDMFDDHLLALLGAVDGTTLPDVPDIAWIDNFVYEIHERIVRAD